MRVQIDDVTITLDDVPIVVEATLSAASGSVVGLVGPNGSGKSTLLRAAYRVLRPVAGRILLDDADVWAMTARTASHHTAVVLQDDSPEFEFTVREVVELGRVAHRGAFERRHPDDADAVAEAMATVGVTPLADRAIATLSGGERQRVYVARALAQRTPVLILDEPTNHLDLLAQAELTHLLTTIPSTVLVALHDLNLAAAVCDVVAVMSGGRVVSHGKPARVLTPELVEQVYGVRASAGTNPLTGTPMLHLGEPLRPRGASADRSTHQATRITTPKGSTHETHVHPDCRDRRGYAPGRVRG